jgi:GTPase SAR1 family protein
MVEPIFDYQFRLILIGDSTVGKSSLLKYFTDGKFAEVMNKVPVMKAPERRLTTTQNNLTTIPRALSLPLARTILSLFSSLLYQPIPSISFFLGQLVTPSPSALHPNSDHRRRCFYLAGLCHIIRVKVMSRRE